jgi:uncharacterized phage infection (PIP) family protein YhgE
MTLTEEIEIMYKEITATMTEINKNILLLIENTNKIADYTINRIKNGHNEITNIKETLNNIDKETEDEYIFRIREILQQLENLLEHEERNRNITIKDLKELLIIKPREIKQLDKIVKREPLASSMLIEPVSSWRG